MSFASKVRCNADFHLAHLQKLIGHRPTPIKDVAKNLSLEREQFEREANDTPANGIDNTTRTRSRLLQSATSGPDIP
jgi:hypothetical protein